MEHITVRARAKINPALEVLGARPDGYHELRMIMQTLRLHDSLFIRKTDGAGLTLDCNRHDLPLDDRNLAYKAAAFLIRQYQITQGVYIYIRKRIPIAAGLAGGSSDCAAVLSGMNRLFNLQIPEHRMMEIGLSFGADVPFCLMGGTALAEGVGDRLTRLPKHPPIWVLLAKPPCAVSTGEIFTLYDTADISEKPNLPGITDALYRHDLRGIANLLCNQLADVTVRLHPEINILTHIMRQTGALNAAMCGSGPTVFGYYTEKTQAHAALCEINRICPYVRDIFLTEVYNDN